MLADNAARQYAGLCERVNVRKRKYLLVGERAEKRDLLVACQCADAAAWQDLVDGTECQPLAHNTSSPVLITVTGIRSSGRAGRCCRRSPTNCTFGSRCSLLMKWVKRVCADGSLSVSCHSQTAESRRRASSASN